MSVYLDVTLLENFIVNFFLLFLTSQTIRVKAKLKNIFIAALVGSLYILCLFIKSLSVFTTFPFKLLAAVILIVLAFRRKEFMFNVKATIIFIIYSMVLAGMCVWLQCEEVNNFGVSAITLDSLYKKLLLATMVLYVFIYKMTIYVKERKSLTQLIYGIKINVNGQEKKIKGFLDTGNELREPASSLPVIIVDSFIFEENELVKYEKYHIPYSVIGGNTGYLIGFKPEKIELYRDKIDEQVEAIIALSQNKLSEMDDYNALLSRGIFD